MLALFSLPIGAILILVLHLLGAKRRTLQAVFFATLGAAFVLNAAGWESAPYHLCQLFVIDNLARLFLAIFIFVVFLGALSLSPKQEKDTEIFAALLLLATFAMGLVASSVSTVALFLSMEFLAIAFYELVALRKDKIGLEAAIKFFVVGVASSLIFLLGAALFYGETGETLFAALANATPTPMLALSLVLMLVGVGFKMSVFPLNLWLPDVYQGSPGEVTAVLAGAVKKAGFAAYLRLFLPLLAPLLQLGAIQDAATFVAGVLAPQSALFRYLAGWQGILALLAFATMTFGSVAAVAQQNVKRLIAYSIIAHAGFITMGLAAANQLGYQGALVHMVIHALMAGGIFIMIGAMEEEGRESVEDYQGVGRQRPLFALVFAIFLASLTGVPPLAGFFSKFLLFSSAVKAGMVWLAAAAIVNSVISSYVYFSLLRRVYSQAAEGEAPATPMARSTSPLTARRIAQGFAYALPAALVVLFGLAPNTLLKLISALQF